MISWLLMHNACATESVIVPPKLWKMASQGGDKGIAVVMKTLAKAQPAIISTYELLKKKLNDFSESYKRMVVEDPAKVATFESTLNLISFVLPGNIRSSDIVSELVYFATKMLALIHDIIYRRELSVMHKFLWTEKTYLESVLTVLEYMAPFLELGAGRLWGESGKWLVVFCFQTLKAALKTILLFVYDTGIQHSPSLLFIKEKIKIDQKEIDKKLTAVNENMPQQDRDMEKAWQDAKTDTEDSKCDVWRGKRSGRTIRSLKSSPPKGFRDWKVPKKIEKESESVDYYKAESKLTYTEKLAELAYILRPLCHLSSMFVCGEKSWKPWLLSMAVDLSSIHHLNSKKVIKDIEKDEIFRRKAALLMYILRSPFYDKYSKAKILKCLRVLGELIPGMKMIAQPLQEYLPMWQQIYSHSWYS
ncbi:peroxisomal membrane protein PEX16-like [Rhopilema esculentum]|uniref:peroxisomal membrane protein PEX16-like n=1 Tax=Rhopilema esculentum TaxID=499914 RepID=UPI0031CEA541|eukprot:gene16505-7924_t